MKIQVGDYIIYNGYQNAKYYVNMISYTGPEPIVDIRKLSRKDTKISAKPRYRPLRFCVKTDPPNNTPEQLKNWIYLLYNPDSNEYKIGRTHNPSQRMKQYRLKYKNIKQLFCKVGVRSFENDFISKFSHKISRPREWFRFDSYDLKLACEFFISF
jgi:hypothetical protein